MNDNLSKSCLKHKDIQNSEKKGHYKTASI